MSWEVALNTDGRLEGAILSDFFVEVRRRMGERETEW